jgi:hypothetical protein
LIEALLRLQNFLDIRRPFVDRTEQGIIILGKRTTFIDLIELTGTVRNSHQSQQSLYQLNLKARSIKSRLQKFVGQWEASIDLEIQREKADSLQLRVWAVTARPELSYKLSGIGRISFRSFILSVSEDEDRSIIRELAQGFPVGLNLGGEAGIELRVSDTFDFKLSARGELRDGEDNRYYLRSELMSRFE